MHAAMRSFIFLVVIRYYREILRWTADSNILRGITLRNKLSNKDQLLLFLDNSPMGAIYRSLSLNSRNQLFFGVRANSWDTYVICDLEILRSCFQQCKYERITITTTKSEQDSCSSLTALLFCSCVELMKIKVMPVEVHPYYD